MSLPNPIIDYVLLAGSERLCDGAARFQATKAARAFFPRAASGFTKKRNRSGSLFVAIPDGKPLRTFPGIA
jgi:hypothetical protein